MTFKNLLCHPEKLSNYNKTGAALTTGRNVPAGQMHVHDLAGAVGKLDLVPTDLSTAPIPRGVVSVAGAAPVLSRPDSIGAEVLRIIFVRTTHGVSLLF
jgi:hypothetical protein